ncbi:MAG: metal-dependent transcriptional regulator [Anaerolineaceae bacterium]|nr:metal-dependent transcriptional regulator [Anaerolineaceae bacterium]
MKRKPTPTIEDYLGVIYTLNRDGEKVIGARLAKLLDVSRPTVTVTLKRMLRDNWISIDKNKHIYLTSSGNKAAQSVIRRHMLTEWLLSRVLNIPWSELHAEAHKLEHSISKDVENRLVATLEDPSSCPHGNPMPGQESISRKWHPLTSFTKGDTCVIKRIHEWLENDPAMMRFLEENLILPGNIANLQEFFPLNKTIQIEITGNLITIGFDAANKIFAERISTTKELK